VHFAGDAARHIGQKVGAGLADFLDCDIATERRVVLVPSQDIAEIADAGAASVLIGPDEMALTRMFFTPRSAAR